MTNQPPDEVGYIEGYRVFKFIYPALELRSFNDTYLWLKGVNEAYCAVAAPKKVLKNGPDGPVLIEVIDHGDIPDPQCGCGFWIYKDIKTLNDKFKTVLSKGSTVSLPRTKSRNTYGDFSDFALDEKNMEIFIAGKVRAWGKVIEGKDGYRTEFCEIVGVCPKSEAETKTLKPLIDKFEIDVCDIYMEFLKAVNRKKVNPSSPYSTSLGDTTSITGYIMEVGRPIIGNTGKFRPQSVQVGIIDTYKTLPNTITVKDPSNLGFILTGLSSRIPAMEKNNPKITFVNSSKDKIDVPNDVSGIMELKVWPSVAEKLEIDSYVGKKTLVDIVIEKSYYSPTDTTSYMIKKLTVHDEKGKK